ncbi:hypothetical protein FISHEDRAFT_36646 [Fistulina hepatica ATCC 64428]|uniref:Core-binding (CB) domain-containing protein n=1 Tax=Fistulina hepatica ATCC 64428 TaxID=1128425 RepID=A0A0D7AI74_9AGAR|nr:hypothetical protein FISHEDRAFT_36646 [Fistulina hepatica ATCC 64428]
MNLLRPIKPRTAREENWIAPSPLRPNCAAADRIFLWKTPAALALDESLREESDRLREGFWRSLKESYAEATRSSYGAGLLRFNQFCDWLGINEARRMPCDATLLASFIGWWAERTSGPAINNWLSGLHAWHVVNRQPWRGDDPLIRLTRRSAKRMGRHFKKPPRDPVSCTHLRKLGAALDTSIPIDAAIWACALSLFWGCRRSG